MNKKHFKYIASSLISSTLDVALFAVLEHFMQDISLFYRVALATLIARILSTYVNFFINKKLVFKDEQPVSKTIYKFFVASAGQTFFSIAGVYILARIFPNSFKFFIKIIVDVVLFFLGYAVQNLWVFPGKETDADAKAQTED